MSEDQVVTITFFHFQGRQNRWWAFQQMGRAPFFNHRIPGLEFAKLLGSGGRNGFSILPNFGLYSLLCVWNNESAANAFFNKEPLFLSFQQKSEEHWTVFMKTTMAHGRWDGEMPFQTNSDFKEDQLMGVITRARIYTKQLWQFWRFVPSVSRSVAGKEGLIFGVGIGELPIVQQATFSLWENSKLMKAYAYQSQHHQKVVKKTRELGWYKEELFARFHPYATEGSWQGGDPLKKYLMFKDENSKNH